MCVKEKKEKKFATASRLKRSCSLRCASRDLGVIGDAMTSRECAGHRRREASSEQTPFGNFFRPVRVPSVSERAAVPRSSEESAASFKPKTLEYLPSQSSIRVRRTKAEIRDRLSASSRRSSCDSLNADRTHSAQNKSSSLLHATHRCGVVPARWPAYGFAVVDSRLSSLATQTARRPRDCGRIAAVGADRNRLAVGSILRDHPLVSTINRTINESPGDESRIRARVQGALTKEIRRQLHTAGRLRAFAGNQQHISGYRLRDRSRPTRSTMQVEGGHHSARQS